MRLAPCSLTHAICSVMCELSLVVYVLGSAVHLLCPVRHVLSAVARRKQLSQLLWCTGHVFLYSLVCHNYQVVKAVLIQDRQPTSSFTPHSRTVAGASARRTVTLVNVMTVTKDNHSCECDYDSHCNECDDCNSHCSECDDCDKGQSL